MSSRRDFISQLSILSLTNPNYNPISVISNSNKWTELKSQYLSNREGFVNMNIGSAGILSRPIYKKYCEHIMALNAYAPYEIYQKSEKEIAQSYIRLANSLGIKADDITLVENSTAGLNRIIWGLPIDNRKEIICANIDYPYATQSIINKANQDSLKIKKINLDLSIMSDTEIVQSYERAINKNTSLLLLTYITHIEGHIMPVKKIIEMAHGYGVAVLLDAAHAYAHIEHSIADLNPDYYVTSLHKWMGAPLGTGLLYVNPHRIHQLLPHSPYSRQEQGTIHKLHAKGTRAFQNEIILSTVLDFNSQVDIAARENRLKALTSIWYDSLSDHKGVKKITQADKYCGMASISLENNKINLDKELIDKYNIHIKKINRQGKKIYRISSGLHLDESDMNKFVNAENTIIGC